MAFKCSECGHSIELAESERFRLAGKFFACPECGLSRRLPLINSPTDPVAAAPGLARMRTASLRFREFVAWIRNRRNLHKPIGIAACVVLVACSLIPFLTTTATKTEGRKLAGREREPAARSKSKANPPVKLPDVRLLPRQPGKFVEPKDDQQNDEPPAVSEPQPPVKPPALPPVVIENRPPIAPTPPGRKPALLPIEDDARILATIRKILSDNLPDGRWTEIEYWPTRTLLLRPNATPFTMARLRYRYRNRFGAMDVADQIFEVSGDTVSTFDEGGGTTYKRMFDLGLRKSFDPVLAGFQRQFGPAVPPDE